MKAYLLKKLMGMGETEDQQETICREINKFLENRESRERLSYKDVAQLTMSIRNKIGNVISNREAEKGNNVQALSSRSPDLYQEIKIDPNLVMQAS